MAVVAEMGCILGRRRRRRGRRPKREIACWKSSSTILQFSAIKAILERSEPAKAPVASSLGIRLKEGGKEMDCLLGIHWTALEPRRDGLLVALGLGQEVTRRHQASELHEIESLMAAAATDRFRGARRYVSNSHLNDHVCSKLAAFN